MKNISVLLFAILMLLAGCERDPIEAKLTENQDNPADALVVKHENKSLMMNICATNCPPCGGWGWTMFDEIVLKTSDAALPLMIYSMNFVAEHLICEAATEIDNHLGVTGYPTFAVNHEMMLSRLGGTVNVGREKEMIYDTIAIHQNAEVIAGAAVNFWFRSGEIGFAYKMTLFEPEVDANYRLAIYIVEHEVEAYQAGYRPDPYKALHPYVLREAYEGAWGIPFSGNNISGAIMKGYGSIPIGVDYSSKLEWDEENIHVYAVIYNVSDPAAPQNGKISFVNAAEGNRILQ